MNPDILVKKLLAQREFWVYLEPGKRVKVRRPAETEILSLVSRNAVGGIDGLSAGIAEVRRYAVDWEGFTEADLIVSGASDAVPFHPDLWATVAEDRRDFVGKVATSIVNSVLEHEKRKAEQAGN